MGGGMLICMLVRVLQLIMGTVAIRHVVAVLTSTPGYIFGIGNFYLFGGKAGALVAAVAKRLAAAAAATAPPIGAGFSFLYNWCLLGNNRLFHSYTVVLVTLTIVKFRYSAWYSTAKRLNLLSI